MGCECRAAWGKAGRAGGAHSSSKLRDARQLRFPLVQPGWPHTTAFSRCVFTHSPISALALERASLRAAASAAAQMVARTSGREARKEGKVQPRHHSRTSSGRARFFFFFGSFFERIDRRRRREDGLVAGHAPAAAVGVGEVLDRQSRAAAPARPRGRPRLGAGRQVLRGRGGGAHSSSKLRDARQLVSVLVQPRKSHVTAASGSCPTVRPIFALAAERASLRAAASGAQRPAHSSGREARKEWKVQPRHHGRGGFRALGARAGVGEAVGISVLVSGTRQEFHSGRARRATAQGEHGGRHEAPQATGAPVFFSVRALRCLHGCSMGVYRGRTACAHLREGLVSRDLQDGLGSRPQSAW